MSRIGRIYADISMTWANIHPVYAHEICLTYINPLLRSGDFPGRPNDKVHMTVRTALRDVFKKVAPLALSAAMLFSACVKKERPRSTKDHQEITGSASVSPTSLLPHAFAHNDYKHHRPLHDALSHGFNAVEADVFIVNDALLVAHNIFDLNATRTLRGLYLDPLRDIVRQRNGQIHADSKESLLLLIDIKSNANKTYAVLHNLLAEYADILTTYQGRRIKKGAVTVILSGKRPDISVIRQQKLRYVAIDGRTPDLSKKFSAALMPLVSADWKTHFGWRGHGPMPESERQRLRQLADAAHQNKQRLRFWGTPALPAVWHELRSAGVDYIGTDDLKSLKEWMQIPRIINPVPVAGSGPAR